MQYITLIFDIKNSRHLNNRAEVQNLLIESIKECNKTYSQYIASPFLITLGDEWQGLLLADSPYHTFIDFFKSKLSTIEFYTAIGVGEITINNFDLTVNQLDGSSFHLARKALKYCKKNNCTLCLLSN